MNRKTLPTLIDGLIAGDIRSLSKLITLVETESPHLPELFQRIFPLKTQAHIIGVCGPPGTGKSTLIDGLIELLREHELKLGVIAVDPTSPYSGGALLGDRIRMQRHATDESVFIRSMATRGQMGGLSSATMGAVQLLDVFGKDVVIIETVGVGQTEVEIAEAADTTILVLTPGAGDQIQVLKAGIMEIGNIFAVNKADHHEADKLILEIKIMLELNQDLKEKPFWNPPVLKTEAILKKGLAPLWAAAKDHRSYLRANGLIETRRKKLVVKETMSLLSKKIWEEAMGRAQSKETLANLKARIQQIDKDPYTAVKQILEEEGIGI